MNADVTVLAPPVRGTTPRGGSRAAVLMTALVAVPGLVVALLFAVPWSPSAGPAGELLDATHPRLTATPADPQDRWVLAQVPPAACTGDCATALADAARRAHVALYKQMPRVRRVWLGTGPDAPRLAERFPDLAQQPLPAAWRASPPGLYLIDPAGNAVLRHPVPQDDAQLQALLRDMNRLLKYSWLG